MAVFGALNAGSVFVEYGMKPDRDSFRDYDNKLDRAVKHAKETERATKRTELGVRADNSGFTKFDKSLRHAENRAKRTGSAMRNHLKIGMASLGILGVASAFKSFVQAGIKAEAGAAQFDNALRHQGITSEQTAKRIKSLFKAQSAVGAYTKGELRKSFLIALRTTGDWQKSIKLNNVAMDVARARGMDLEAAMQMIARATITGGKSLRRFGVDAGTVTANTDRVRNKWDRLKESSDGLTMSQKQQMKAELDTAKAQDKRASSLTGLAKLQAMYAGSAKAFGETTEGKLLKFQVAWAAFQGAVGKKLLPALTPVITAATAGVQKFTDAIESGKGPVANFFKGVEKLFRGGGNMGQQLADNFNKAMEYVITNAVPNLAKNFWNAFWNTGWAGKASIAALLVWKLGPAFAAAGGKLMGRFGKGGAAGGLGGVAGGVVPVYVTNMGGAGIPGAPGKGGKGGKGGWLGRIPVIGGLLAGAGAAMTSGVSIPGIGAGVGGSGAAGAAGGGALAGLGLPAAGIAAVIALGAVVATKISGQGGLSKPATPATLNAGRKLGETANLKRGQEWAREFRLDAGSKVPFGEQLRASIKGELDQVPEDFRKSWAEGVIKMAVEMRAKGELPKGAARTIANELAGNFKVISPAAATQAMRTAAAMQRIPQSVRDAQAQTANPLARMGTAHRKQAEEAAKAAHKTDQAMWKTRNSVTDSATPIGDALRSIGGAFKSAASKAWDFAKGAAASGWGAIKSGVAAILPGMATGGYVAGPRGKGLPVTLHGDEYVINSRQAALIGRDRLDAALAATGAPTLRAGGSYRKGARPAGPIPGTKAYEREFSVLDHQMALAEGTEDESDDKIARGLIRNLLQRRIDQLTRFLGMKKYSKAKWPLMYDEIFQERTSLTRSLNSYMEPRELTPSPDALARTQTPGEAAAAMIAARTDLYRDFGSNFATAGPGGAFAGARSGATVNVPVTFTEPPRDPHAFAKSLAFELRGAM